MDKEEQKKKMEHIITKAWADEAFKQRLLADATAVLKEEGVPVPEGIVVKAVEDTDAVFHMVLPQKPAGRELSEDELSHMAAGWGGTPTGETELYVQPPFPQFPAWRPFG